MTHTLAFTILGLFYLFVASPMLGEAVLGRGGKPKYLKCLWVGLKAITLIISILCIILGLALSVFGLILWLMS